MTKRFVSLALVLAMVLCMIPVAVTAEGTVQASPKAGTHQTAGHTCEACEEANWQPWPTDGTRPAEGHYYLTQDVQLSGMISVKAGKSLHLCLNGYVMTAASDKRLMSASEAGAEIVITDCTAYTDENDVYQAGALTGGVNVGTSGAGAIYIATNAVVKLYDGRITGNMHKNDSGSGGAIVLGSKGSGGVPGGAFYMYDGEISNNAAYKAIGEDLRPAGAIYINNGAVVEISGGTIKNNTGSSGGAINVQTGGKLTVANAKITGNTGTNGGAIYATGSAQVIIADSEITGNTGTSDNAAGRCAAVYTDGSGNKVTLIGKVIIADNNMAVAGIADLTMSATKAHTVYVKDMEPGSRVNFRTTGHNPTLASQVLQLDTQQTDPWQSVWMTYTDKDGNTKQVGLVNGEFVWGHYHGTQEYTALENAAQLESGGSYYLADNVRLNEMAELDKKGITLHLCLYGHDLSPAEGERLMKFNGTRNIQVVIDDCTAHTDENGSYQAGRLTGAENSGTNGGLIQVGSTDTLILKNGKITGNKGKSGGALILDGTFRMEGGEVSHNQSINNGGAVYINSGGSFEMTGGIMHDNQGKNGGAVYGAGTVSITGGSITRNTATASGGAIGVTGTKTMLLQDVSITGNIAAGGGAVYVTGTMGAVILAGETTITGNTSGNLYLCKNYSGVAVSDLTGTVGVTLAEDRIDAGQMYITDTLADDVDPSGCFLSDNSEYEVKLENKRVVLAKTGVTPPAVEPHLHGEQEYIALENAAQLESGGFYYLADNVRLDEMAELDKKDITLHLCLYGHDLSPAEGERLMKLNGTRNIQVVIDDCTAHKDENGIYQAGRLTGAENSGTNGGLIQVGSTDTLILKNGKITKNNGKSGGALILDGTFRMEGGEVSSNQSVNNGGAVYINSGGTFQMTGGTLKDNQGNNGGAVYGSGTIEITGGSFVGNTAKGNGGAICLTGSKTMLLQDVTVTGNTGSGGAVYVGGSVDNVTVSGKTVITGNTSGNLELDGDRTVTLNALHADAKIGVTGTPLRYISGKCDDYTANVLSDNTKYQVVYKDGALYLDAAGNHRHCFCAGISSQCGHTQQTYIEWDDPNELPPAGNYYLSVDVVIDKRAGLNGAELNLCLNGHTITTKDRRAFYLYEDSVLRISDCSAQPGKITGATAGAIVADSTCENALVELYGGVLTGNENVSLGGAVMIQGKTTFNMYGGTITGNAVHSKLNVDENGNPVLDEDGAQTVTSTRGGGGVGLYGKETVFHMYGGKISENETTKAVYLDKNGEETSGGGLGGGVHCDKGSAYIYGGEISGNTTDRSGGGLIVMNAGLLEIHGGRITGNHAAAGGGGFYVSTNCFLNMTGGEVTGNTAKNAGGFHANTGAKVTVTGGKISGNRTTSSGGGIVLSGKGVVMTMTGGEVSGNAGSSGGGILAQSGATLNLNGGKVTGNSAKYSGGGIYISDKSVLNMSGGSVTSNKAKSDAGGIMLVRCDATFTGGTVSYNSTEASGGGMKMSGAKVSASGLTMTGNTAKKHAGAIVTGSSSKTTNGVKVTYYLTVNMYGCYFSGNTCASSGGALLIQSKGTQFNMTNCTFNKNEAKSGGGAFYVSSNVTFKMTGGKVTENYAAAGGAARLNKCTAELTDVVIQENTAKNGGGLYCSGEATNAKFSGLKVLDNVAITGVGGGIYSNKATIDITDSVISGNISEAKSGGGIYMTGRASLTVNGGEISNNSCATLGGGIYVARGGTAEFTNVNFLNNTNVGNGGAVNCGGSMVFTGCQFSGNTSKSNGGAIATNMTGSQWTQDRGGVFLTDCILADNSADGQGGGLYIHRGGPAHLVNVSITENISALEGSGIYADGIMELTDVSVKDNCSDSNGYAVYVGPGEWDGFSYTTGMRKLAGDVIIQNNNGGDMYLADGAVAAVSGATLGDKAQVNVTLSDGVLTQRIIGIYHYEGEGLTYTLTAGDRSIAEPMAPVTQDADDQTDEAKAENTLLYVGVGVFVVAIIAVIALVLLKKKKAGKAAAETSQE